MSTTRRRYVAVPALLAALAALLCAAPAAAGGSEVAVELSAEPVDQPATYFDVTVEPGEQRRLRIALGNHGDETIAARTYPADVETIINGGFGARLRGEPATGTTTWLGYPTEVLRLAAGEVVVRPFTVRVPEGTPPGEYVTAVVLENDEPVEGTGPVALDQVVRQAVAVSVRVPGDLVPALEIGQARHTVVAGRSVVAVDVSNPGTVRLEPAGELRVRDGDGRHVSRTPVAMDSFYAQTDTLVEVTLASALPPGQYTLDLTLSDPARGATAQADGLTFVVAGPSAPVREAAPAVEVVEALRSGTAGLPLWAIGVVALGVVVTAAVARVRHVSRTGSDAATA